MQVDTPEAKRRLTELIELALAGVDIVITTRGAPAVRLVSSQVAQSESSAKSFLQWLELNSRPEYLQRGHAEIELGIRQERAAWES